MMYLRRIGPTVAYGENNKVTQGRIYPVIQVDEDDGIMDDNGNLIWMTDDIKNSVMWEEYDNTNCAEKFLKRVAESNKRFTKGRSYKVYTLNTMGDMIDDDNCFAFKVPPITKRTGIWDTYYYSPVASRYVKRVGKTDAYVTQGDIYKVFPSAVDGAPVIHDDLGKEYRTNLDTANWGDCERELTPVPPRAAPSSPDQQDVMRFCPATGKERPYPSHAQQWRTENVGHAWLYNPWTGQPRRSEDVGSDLFGMLIINK